MRKIKDAAIESALAAGSYIKKNIGKIKNISFKGDTNLVTDIDKTSEAIIVSHLRKNFPDFSILAEEDHNIQLKNKLKWIIDPLDGTVNFAHGFPFFAVSVGLEDADSGIIMGVIYDPMRSELFFAEKGRGAYLNNKKIRVSKIRDIKKSLLSTGFAYDSNPLKHKNLGHFTKFLLSAQAIRRSGSAALDLCYVACGRFDGFWELDLKPWDVAAGRIIVEEAGGKVTKFDGADFSHYDTEVLASNGLIHSPMVKVLKLRD